MTPRSGTYAEMLALEGMLPGVEFIVNSGMNAGSRYEYRGATAGWVLISTATGAGLVMQGGSGVMRTRQLSAATTGVAGTSTPPTEANAGFWNFGNPVNSVVIKSVSYVSGTLPVASTDKFTVAYAIDPANEGAAAILLPTTIPAASATTERMQIGSFNLTPVWNGTNFALVMDKSHEVDLGPGVTISKFAIVHYIGTSLVLAFDVSATEAV